MSASCVQPLKIGKGMCAMKKLAMIMMLMPLMALADTEVVDGIPWTYTVSGGKASLGTGDFFSEGAVARTTSGELVIPSKLGGRSVTSIGDYAFCECNGLTSVTIPSSVTSIGDQAFCECNGLTSVTIPSSVTSIGDEAFSGRLTSISVDANNPSYSSQNGILYNKTKSELICCPGGKTGAVAIPSSVTSIRDQAFLNCWSLTSVTIPSSVTSIGVAYLKGSAFATCSGMTSISVEANNSSYSSQNGILYNKAKSELICCPGGKTGAVTIPSSVSSIGDSAFYGCSGLTSVTIPSSVMSIGFDAFSFCSRLTSVTIPSSVTSIGEWAFDGCSGLTSVTIPSSVTSIGDSAFKDCSSLKTVYVAIGDTRRIKNMLSGSGLDVSGLQFVESGTAGEGGEEGDGGGFDGSVKHTFNGLVRDANNEPCGLIQVTTAKATKKGVKVGGFVMLEDGKKVTMKAVTVAVQNGLLAVSTTVGKLGGINLTIGGDGFAGTFGAKKVASEKLDEDTGVLKTTVKVTYLDAATGKLKTKNMTLNGVAVPQSAAGVLTSKGSAAKEFEAEVDCEACRPE